MSFKVQKHLVPIKAHYFLYFGGSSPILPFLPVIIRNMGFSNNMVGIIFLWLPICGMIAKTVFGALADKYKKQRFFFLLFIFLTIIFEASFFLIPSATEKPSVSLECTMTGTNFNFCHNGGIAKNGKQAFLNDNSSSIPCHLICEINDRDSLYLAEELCKSWGSLDLCRRQNILDDKKNTSVLISSESIQRDISPKSQNREKYVFNKDLHFDFSTFISTKSAYDMNNCMYFPLEQANHQSIQAPSLKCKERRSSVCSMQCDNIALNELWLQSMAGTRIKDADAFFMPLFWLLFFILTGMYISLAVITIIADAVCFKLLDGEPELFGRQRLWGSFGWAIFSTAAGYLVDFFNEGKLNANYNLVFYMSIGLFIIDFVFASKVKCVQTKISTNIFKDVSKLLKDPRVIVFVSWCATTGLFTALVWNFLYLYIEDLASAYVAEKDLMVKTLQGLVTSVQSFGEMPFFFLSGSILKKLGHGKVMSLLLAAFSIRFILISTVVNPWHILPIELLSGLTYGVLTSTMNSYASILAPPGTESTMQGLVGAIFEGIGVSVGSYVCGSLFDMYGGRIVFQIFAASAAVACVLHVLIQYMIHLRRLSKGYKDRNKSLKEESTNECLQMH